MEFIIERRGRAQIRGFAQGVNIYSTGIDNNIYIIVL